MRLSFTTLLGVLVGALLIGWGIHSSTDNWRVFISIPSLQIVLGGTIATAFIGYKWNYVLSAFLNVFEIFVENGINAKSLKNDVEVILGWANSSQKVGSNNYDSIASNLSKKDGFSRYLLTLMSTGYSTDEIREFGENSIEETYFRRLTGSNILSTMSATAPAFGMIGTLIGLIAMFGKMDDPSNIGAGLAVALITTLYGVLFARFLFDPTATKVKQIYGLQRFREYLYLEGLLMVMENRSTFYMRDKLNSYLDRSFLVSGESRN